MRKRRIVTLLAIVAAVALIAGCLAAFVGCTKDNGSITVWGPQEQQEMLKTMVAKFKEANPDVKLEIKVGVCSEADAKTNVTKDPSAAADVFAFANDQLVEFLRVGALAEVGGQFKEDVIANNLPATVGYATFADKLYGYPYSSDNTYFVYYDKSVVSADQVKTVEGIIKACQDGNKQIAWEIGNGWYDAAFFFAFGGSYNVTYNDDFTEKEIACNFKGEAGLKATKAIRKIAESGVFCGEGTAVGDVLTDVGEKYAIAVTGSWNADAIKEKLGENYAIAPMPTVTVDDETKQLIPFMGGKVYGVNATSKHLVEAHKLAAFLTNEDMQKLRFEEKQVGPSNKKVVELDMVKENPIVAVVSQQAEFGKPQVSVPALFWDPVDAYCTWAAGKEYSADQVQTKLNAMQDLIKPEVPQFKRTADVYLIGSINDWKPEDLKAHPEYKFTVDSTGLIYTLEIELHTGDEVKAYMFFNDAYATQGYGSEDWSDADNTKIEADGTYILTYDRGADKLTAVKK